MFGQQAKPAASLTYIRKTIYIVADNIRRPSRKPDGRCFCLFTDPEFGRIGE
jgi:hypothetical protein